MRKLSFMRKYYLFIIKPEYHKSFLDKPNVLFETLCNLYGLKDPNFTYGISLFDSICQPVSTKLLNNYIQNRYTCTLKSDKVIQVHSVKEKTFLQVNRACIIVKSNVNFPEVMKIFQIYNKNIFVCDFQNSDYFWLTRQIQKRK